MKKLLPILFLSWGNLSSADEVESGTPVEKRLEQSKKLVQENEDEKAVAEYEAIIETHPKNGEAHTSLGGLLAMKLKRAEEGVSYLKGGWELGDQKALYGLALVWLLTSDEKSIMDYQNDFVDNFEQLAGSKFIAFYVAAARKDKVLFLDLLSRVDLEDVQKDDTMAKMIARAAKATLAN